jgi:4'-phosphopantetheinyl transferase
MPGVKTCKNVGVNAVTTESSRSLAPEIHVWRIALTGDADRLGRCWALLDESERDRAERSRTDAFKRRQIVAQGALRQILARYTGMAPAAIRFERNAHGKPRLAGSAPDRGWAFNVSHSEDQALIAIGRDITLGIDLEVHRPNRDLEGLVRYCFAPEEQDYWRSLPEAERSRTFFEVWTAKEAFVKAVGRGLGLGLKRCVLAPGDAPRFLAVPEGCGRPEDWALCRLQLEATVSATLCAKAQHLEFRVFDFERV